MATGKLSDRIKQEKSDYEKFLKQSEENRIRAIEIERINKQKRDAEDSKNLGQASGLGILGALGGGIAGFVVGFIVGLLLEIISCTKHEFDKTYQADPHSGGYAVIICTTIGVIIGFISMFTSHRKKY